MSLYSEYIREICGKECLETAKGFATYWYPSKDECYIEDIYTAPDFRQSHEAAKLADQITSIAKEKGCKFLTGSVCTKIKDPTRSMKVLLAYGFKFLRSTPEMLYFVKEI